MEFTDFEDIGRKCKDAGIQIDNKDISFCFLNNFYKNSEMTYYILFGQQDRDIANEYSSSTAITALNDIVVNQYIRTEIDRKVSQVETAELEAKLQNKSKESKEDNITFKDNKKGMIKLLKSVKKAVETNSMPLKDALKIEADIRMKLNDKFGATDDEDTNIVVVERKFTGVCKYCGHEI